jgi:hypothetical protein
MLFVVIGCDHQVFRSMCGFYHFFLPILFFSFLRFLAVPSNELVGTTEGCGNRKCIDKDGLKEIVHSDRTIFLYSTKVPIKRRQRMLLSGRQNLVFS